MNLLHFLRHFNLEHLHCRNMEMLTSLIIVYLITGTVNCEVDFQFKDSRQAEYASQLTNFEISHPSKVSHNGDFLSHTLHNVIPHRSKRDTTANNIDEKLHYKVNIDNSDYHLTLEPNHRLLSPGLIIERRRNRHGNISYSDFRRQSGHHCHYTGTVTGHSDSMVAIATCNGLTGLIRTKKGEFFIEPVKGHNTSSNDPHPHLIYRRSAVPLELGGHTESDPHHHGNHKHERETATCGVTENAEDTVEKQRERWENHVRPSKTKEHKRRSKRSISQENNVETLVVIDTKMVEYYKNDDIEVYILTILNMVSSMYHDKSLGNAVNIVLVKLIYLEEPEDELPITHHADNTLNHFCKWQNKINPRHESHPNHHDVAVLLTRYNICSRLNEPCSTLGLAHVSGMCQPHRMCNINEDTGLALSYTIAHELGHNFGMKHDGAHNGCQAKQGDRQHVMAPQLIGDNEPLIWSNCSRKAITTFLDRDWGFCLQDEPSDHDFNYPVLPAGALYTVDHQCQLQYGPSAEYCEGIDDLCATLWCKIDNKCLTRLETTAEGTQCGLGKWCYSGKCIEMGQRPNAIRGEWGQWGSWSGCSRTCGGGVRYRERLCNNPAPSNGGKYCLGERKLYDICSTKGCISKKSFLQTQCEEFNYVPYKNGLYEWEVVRNPASPCQLHCKPVAEYFSVLLKDIVTDGTPCRAGTKDMCINGLCQHVGCDWGIGSDAKEDRCGVCHGDGSTCKTVQTKFDKTNGIGYVEATVIPKGARNIRIEEVAEANNFLAIKNSKGKFFLNGHWFIQWSGDYKAAGTTVHYNRDGNKETLNAEGPLTEPLHILLLFQSQNPGVKFEYTVPNANASRMHIPVFKWEHEKHWSHCSVSCGGGHRRKEVVCKALGAGEVDSSYCNATTKPDDLRASCNTHSCPARWWPGPWQHCSVTCGRDGIHRRTVICVQGLGMDRQIALDDSNCEDTPKPTDVEACHHKDPCPEDVHWEVGPWSDTCNGDPCMIQTRNVQCSDRNSLIGCDPLEMPSVMKQCTNITCGQWAASEWTQCTRSCESGVQIRKVTCVGGSVCPQSNKPTSQQECNTQLCPTTTTTTTTTMPPTTITTSTPSATSPENISTSSPIDGATTQDVIKNKEFDERKSENEINKNYITPDTKHKHHSKNNHLKDNVKNTEDIHPAPIQTIDGVTTSKMPSETIATEISKTVTIATEPSTSNQLEITNDSEFKNTQYKEATTSAPTRHVTSATAATEDTLNVDSLEVNDFEWLPLNWAKCTRPCGEGIKKREVICASKLLQSEVEASKCASLPAVPNTQPCNVEPCVEWEMSEWSTCSKTCGRGSQEREVTCPIPNMCDDEMKPQTVQLCELQACSRWVSGQWSKCTRTCGGGNQIRHVQCVDNSNNTPTTGCNPQHQPKTSARCNTAACTHHKSAHLNTGKFQCRRNTMSNHICGALKRFGQCQQRYVQLKCCRTCNSHRYHRTKSRLRTRTT